MRMKKNKIFVGLLLLFILGACSATSEENKTEIENSTPVKADAPEIVKYSFNELESWINLMPGGSDTFHLSGDLVVTNKSALNLVKAKILNVLIYQDGKELYDFKPESKKGSVSKEESVYFQFSTKRGMKISGVFNPELPVTVEVNITDGKENMVVTVDKVIVQKIY